MRDACAAACRANLLDVTAAPSDRLRLHAGAERGERVHVGHHDQVVDRHHIAVDAAVVDAQIRARAHARFVDGLPHIRRYCDLVGADGRCGAAVECRPGHHVQLTVLLGQLAHLFFDVRPFADVELMVLWDDVGHGKGFFFRAFGRCIAGRRHVPAVVAGVGVVGAFRAISGRDTGFVVEGADPADRLGAGNLLVGQVLGRVHRFLGHARGQQHVFGVAYLGGAGGGAAYGRRGAVCVKRGTPDGGDRHGGRAQHCQGHTTAQEEGHYRARLPRGVRKVATGDVQTMTAICAADEGVPLRA